MSRHSTALYCPFCGDQDLWPSDAAAQAWRCRSCTRAFVVSSVRAAPDDVITSNNHTDIRSGP